MSELKVPQGGGLVVTEVANGSPADRAGILPGDVLLAANGRPLQDVIDLRFEAADSAFTLTVRRDGRERETRVERGYGEDLGIALRFELADRIHTCNNRCVFCFIHQMPKRMRRSLYLMDDDYRLSFLHGNYVTLTNLAEGEFERIRGQGLSPMYVSVHATDPALRARMLGKSEPVPILPQLRELAAHGISVHAQIVLCPGWNDGEGLERTVRELADLHPEAAGGLSGVLSVAVVPVGLTQFRSRLTDIRPVDKPYAERHLELFEKWRFGLRARLGTAFLFPSDEWFFIAERPFPPRAWYEDFPQFEDGIGTCRTFLDETAEIVPSLSPSAQPVRASLLTAKLAAGPVGELARRLNGLDGIDLNVCVVPNDFFGRRITVAGLMAGGDMLNRMRWDDVRDTVYVPRICVNDDGLLLDDLPAERLGAAAGKDVRFVEPTPSGLARDLGVM